MNGSTVFSKLDMNMGFHPIEIEEGSSDTTTFSAGATFYRYKTSRFGVNSAPEQYQNIFKQTITDCPSATNVADDIIVYEQTTEEHESNLVTLLERLQERNRTLNKDKCKNWNESNCFYGTASKWAWRGINRGKGKSSSWNRAPY